MLFSKDEKIEQLEKRLNRLEKTMDRKFDQIESSFKIFKDVVIKLQTEKAELERNRDFLLEKQKEMLRKVTVNEPSVQRIVEPVQDEFKENYELIRKLARDIEKGE